MLVEGGGREMQPEEPLFCDLVRRVLGGGECGHFDGSEKDAIVVTIVVTIVVVIILG